MPTLSQDARSYLEAGGFRLVRAQAGFLDCQRTAAHGSSNRILVWVDEHKWPASSELGATQRVERDAFEASLLRSFEKELRSAPDAVGVCLVHSRQGYTQNFIAEATRFLRAPGGVRVPIEFFDASYKIERAEARRARSILGDVLALAEKVRRVAQPFSMHTDLSAGTHSEPGGDLVEHLETAIADPIPGPKLRIIDGPAGSGKTVAFNALASALYNEFIAAKRARHQRARPIVFLPEHLRGKKIGYVDDVIAAVTETDVAELTSAEQFKWLLKSGHALWMFDGLDEFCAGGDDFFNFLEAALTAPGSQAQFVICARESLLNSSPAVREFVERQIAAGVTTEIYELSPWTSQAWRQLAWLELENGRQEALRSARVERFVSALEGSDEIAALAQLPFYCSVLLAHFKQNNNMPRDELDVLELLIDSMIRREHGKRVFQWQDFVDVETLVHALEDETARLGLPVPSGDELEAAVCALLDEQAADLLFELIGGLAHRQRRTASAVDAASGFTVDDARELVSAGRVAGINDEGVMRRLRLALVRFAFFGPGRRSGSLDFTHEILADYFAAHYAMLMIERALRSAATEPQQTGYAAHALSSLRAAFIGAVGSTKVVPGSLFHRYFARHLDRQPLVRSALKLLLQQGDLGTPQATDALRLLLGESPSVGTKLHTSHPVMPASPSLSVTSRAS